MSLANGIGRDGEGIGFHANHRVSRCRWYGVFHVDDGTSQGRMYVMMVFERGVRAWCSSVVFERGVRAWCSSVVFERGVRTPR